jgi:hypothetical protein
MSVDVCTVETATPPALFKASNAFEYEIDDPNVLDDPVAFA